MSTFELWLALGGMAVITVITRGFFFLPRAQWPMPSWLQQGLRYAPLAAMVAVVVPEIVMTHGELIGTWKEPRVFAAAMAAAWFFWRRDMLGTIVVGTLGLVLLRFVLPG
jgi:branched-subunit amino acid transport protein